MVDEISADLPYQKRTFISKLNPESPPFEPSTSYQHIQEVSQAKFISKDNLHIQPITNGHQNNENYYSTTIHSIESSEHIPTQIHYIQETKPDYQQSVTSSHIEPVNISYDDKKEENIDQISFQQSDELESTSSLPDVVTETLEQNSDNSIRQTEPDDILGNNSLLKQVEKSC